MRVIGPALSLVCEMGMMPLRLHRPTVGFIPTMPLALEGQTIDPLVSVPMVNVARLAAAATAGPELEPQGLRCRSWGFFT